jgi:hypothetical protein
MNRLSNPKKDWEIVEIIKWPEDNIKVRALNMNNVFEEISFVVPMSRSWDYRVGEKLSINIKTI